MIAVLGITAGLIVFAALTYALWEYHYDRQRQQEDFRRRVEHEID